MSLEKFSDLFKDYYNHYKKYSELYGEDTVILHQTGHFYEVYDYPEDSGFLCSDIYKVSNILNLNVTRRDKNKELSEKNWLMSGVPLMKLEKYSEILLENNYHVIIVSQTSAPPNPEREVTAILSPGTNINCSDNNKIENNLMSIFIEKSTHSGKDIFSAGLSMIDVTTGKNKITDVIHSYEDENYTDNEIKRLLNYYNPVELLIHTKDFSESKENLINKYDINCSIYVNFYSDNKEFLKKNYQNELLKKVFNNNSCNSIIEELNLERREEVLISYIYLLNYIHQHKPELIKSLEHPEEINNTKYLVLTADSVRQLNIFNNYSFYSGRNKDLFSLLNKTVTPLGKRLYKNRLLYPCLNVHEINNRYDIVDLLIKDSNYEKIRTQFSRINDFEKSLRKMSINLLTTPHFYSDYLCYEYVINNINFVRDYPELLEKYDSYIESFDKFNEYNTYISNTFEFNNFSSYLGNSDIQKSLFKPGIYEDLDECTKQIQEKLDCYSHIIKKLSQIIDPKNNNLVKLDFSDKLSWFLHLTKNRSNQITKYLANKKISVKDNYDETIVKLTNENLSFKTKDNSNVIIQNKFLNDLSNDLVQLNRKITDLNKKYWDIKINEIYSCYNKTLTNINKFIADLDCHSSNAFTAIKNQYFKPCIEVDDNDKSYVDIIGLRHPIAEQINKEKEFIKNDIHLGCDNKNQSGILLYGLNSSGKSTTSKAIALSLVMAQSGCYVPASKFVYNPYSQIFTRILNNDKLWSGLSSFGVECKEISHITLNANKNSFVIGDEIFSSTESDSAISLVNAVIHKLHKLNCSYIFATHFHELIELPDIKELIKKDLKIYHLQVRVENNVLLFDRILKDGNGPTDYGILVAQTLGLPNDVISMANKTKLFLKKSETLITDKKSQYNSNLFMNKCKMPGCYKDAQETHHIKEQKDADKNGNIGSINKNDLHNLCPLCKEHHAEITYGKLNIKGYLDTSDGLKLDYEYLEEKKSKKKFDEKQISIIKEYYENNKTFLKKKDIIIKLLQEREIDVSVTLFNKIIKNTY